MDNRTHQPFQHLLPPHARASLVLSLKHSRTRETHETLLLQLILRFRLFRFQLFHEALLHLVGDLHHLGSQVQGGRAREYPVDLALVVDVGTAQVPIGSRLGVFWAKQPTDPPHSIES